MPPPTTRQWPRWAGRPRKPQESRPGLRGEPSGTEKWRQQLQVFAGGILPNYGALALDRQLFLKSIPVDPKTGERLALKRAELHANVYITATRVELGESKIDGKPRKFAVLFATLQKMDILGPDNELIAAVKPEVLPGPKVVTAGAPPSAPKPPATPPAGPDPGRARQGAGAGTPREIRARHRRPEEEGRRRARAVETGDSLHAAGAQGAPRSGQPGVQEGICRVYGGWAPNTSGGARIRRSLAFCSSLYAHSNPPRWCRSSSSTSRASRAGCYWLDFSGTRRLRRHATGSARPDAKVDVSHPWMVSDASDTCLGTIVISPDLKQVVIR